METDNTPSTLISFPGDSVLVKKVQVICSGQDMKKPQLTDCYLHCESSKAKKKKSLKSWKTLFIQTDGC